MDISRVMTFARNNQTENCCRREEFKTKMRLDTVINARPTLDLCNNW